jgi:hypothetical protein
MKFVEESQKINEIPMRKRNTASILKCPPI